MTKNILSEFDPSIAWAAGAIISNIPDLKTYAKALVEGKLISAQSQNEREKFINTGTADYLKYGLGLLYLGGFIGHNGGITGFNTSMYYNPEVDALIIVSVNEYGGDAGKSDAIFAKIAEYLYPEKNFFKK